MYCENCGSQIADSATVCPKCGVVQKTNLNVVDNGGFGWCLLGFCIPIVGLTLYLAWQNYKPITGKAAGKGALISVIIWIASWVLLFVIGMGIGAGTMA